MAQALADEDLEIEKLAHRRGAGFGLPGAAEAQQVQGGEIDPTKGKKKRAGSFLEILAEYYGVNATYFDTLKDHKGDGVASILDAYKALSQPKDKKDVLVALNVLGAQVPFDIRRDSVRIQKGTTLTMQMAIDMALAAKANPAFADGVDVSGTPAEMAMLTAAAMAVGLKITNVKKVEAALKKVDPALFEKHKQEAVSILGQLKVDAAERVRFENEDEVSSVPEQPKEEGVTPQRLADLPENNADRKNVVDTPAVKTAANAAAALADAPNDDASKNNAGEIPEALEEGRGEAAPAVVASAVEPAANNTVGPIVDTAESAANTVEPISDVVEPIAEPKKGGLDFAALSPEQQQKVRDFFRQQNEKDIDDGEIERRWQEWPESIHQRGIASDFNKEFNDARMKRDAVAAAAAAAPVVVPVAVPVPVVAAASEKTGGVEEDGAGEKVEVAEIIPPAEDGVLVPVPVKPLEAGATEPSQQTVNVNFIMMPPKAETGADGFGKDAPPVAVAFTQAKQLPLLLEDKSAERERTVAEILDAGGVPLGLYELVKFRVVDDNDARVRHVENIIGEDNNIPGSTKAAQVILHALEADGVVEQPGGKGNPRKVVHQKGHAPSKGDDSPRLG